MSTRNIQLLALCLWSLFAACKKDPVDLGTLTTNPFDADYSGAPIFTEFSVGSDTLLVNGIPVIRLTATVQVHTELFGRPTPYVVETRLLPSGSAETISSFFITDDRLQLQLDQVEVGQQYCWALRLGNPGSFGGGNEVCVTVE